MLSTRPIRRFLLRALLFTCWGIVASTQAEVVVNEIMYHPREDRDALQYIELFNNSRGEADLSGWKLAGGIKFSFPGRTRIAPGGFLVVCRDARAFQQTYGATAGALGNFSGRLSHKGEEVRLVDASGHTLEKVRFGDQAPWPLGPDGYGASLERICPNASAEDPSNWASSAQPASLRPGGSPGEVNGSYSALALPGVENVRWEMLPRPNQPIKVTAEVRAEKGVSHLALQYQLIVAGRTGAITEVPMRPSTGDAKGYACEVPPQPAGTLLRFTLNCTDLSGASRIEPGPSEPRPAFSAYVTDPPQRAAVPILTLLNAQTAHGNYNKMAPPLRSSTGTGGSAALYVPVQGEVRLCDFARVRRRAGGWKIHLLHDELIDGMSAFNVIFEGPPRWVLSEHLSYELYRAAGMNIEKSGHVRLVVDGRVHGYHLLVEQPNKRFLKRSGRDETGNLYKVLWFGNGIINQHEKKTNPETGHEDIVTLIEGLRRKSGAAQWEFINENFNVDAFANYYAVNMCIENWDGFFNNHFVYHDPKPGGKWDIIPWDEDKTWGDYDGAPSDYSWYSMPLTMGMAGDSPGRLSWFGGGPFGGEGWWRPGGYLSKPLLANSQFRQKFEARLKELCTSVFTEEKFGPVVDQLRAALRPDVELKARNAGQDPAWAVKQFDADIASFHRQLDRRRKFILKALAK